MPRRVRTRATRQSNLDPALLDYLIDGDGQAAKDSRRARGLPILIFYRHHEMARLWLEHRAEILEEAKRRGVRPKAVHGAMFDRFDPKTGDFTPQNPRDTPDYPGEPGDPREVLTHEHEAQRGRRT